MGGPAERGGMGASLWHSVNDRTIRPIGGLVMVDRVQRVRDRATCEFWTWKGLQREVVIIEVGPLYATCLKWAMLACSS